MTHMTIEKKVRTKKGHQIFGQKKCTPAEKIVATSMTVTNGVMITGSTETVELFGVGTILANMSVRMTNKLVR